MANILIILKKQLDLSTFTSMTHEVGTIAYMAPEFFNYESQYKEKVNLYSFGVEMYFIVTKGQMPKYNPTECFETATLPKTNCLDQLSKDACQKRPSTYISLKGLI
ncbi:hypothetical protein M9Y10_025963 [Tritrichomonas musculus]|uniref:Protein kinase domain-containing protein n=1 Tax=Tritrichomonas musculus TaxID=1915356 RepID=A0ABR2H872_9EUKA